MDVILSRTMSLWHRELMEFFLSKRVEFNFIFHRNFSISRARAIYHASKKSQVNLQKRFSNNFLIYQATMASGSSSSSKAKRGSKMLVKGVGLKAPNFKLVPAIAESLDPNGAQLKIPPKVLLINDIHTHFKCVVQEIGTLEMDSALGKMCVDGTLKPEHKHLEEKGLTHISHLQRNF